MRMPGYRGYVPRLAATAAVLFAAAVQSSSAADLVVAAYGGVWQTATQKCFADPFEKKTGTKVSVILGTSPQWMNQVEANPTKPPVDLILVAPDGVIHAIKRGIADPLDKAKLPVMSELDPTLLELGRGYAVVVGYSSLGLAYNKNAVKNPPKTWEEYIARSEKGEWNTAIPGLRQASTPDVVLWMQAHLAGGGVDNIEPAFNTIKRLKSGGKMHVWNDMNQFLTELKTGETDIGMYWEGRTWAFHDAGNPEIGFIKPLPSVPIHSTLVLKAKNSNPLAWDFLNLMLGKEAMACFGNMLQYGTGNAHVRYSDVIQERIAKMNEVTVPPYEAISSKVSAWVERWNKEVGN